MEHSMGSASISSDDLMHLWSKNLDQEISPGQRQVQSFEAMLQGEAKFLRRQLEDCLLHHGECRIEPVDFQPRRLLQITGHRSSPHIRPPETTKSSVPYLCLSYCWGGDQLVNLTKDRLSLYEDQIPSANFGRTVYDAIRMVCMLGFKYLWVDAFCILQDSAEDKILEIANMSLIYAGAVCTISVDSAATADDGFLDTRTIATTTLLRRPGRRTSVLEVDDHPPQERERPLRTRAWRLQETVLSSRLLTVSAYRIPIQRCRMCSVRGDAGITTKPKPYFQDLFRQFKSNSHSAHNPTCRAIVCWRYLVEQYSSREISQPRGKLLAISGIATKLQQEFATPTSDLGTYVAGVWSDTDCLLWKVRPGAYMIPKPERKPEPVYIAPSWSWASRTQAVFYDPHILHNHHFMAVQCTASFDVDLEDQTIPTGCIKSASVTLSCKAAQHLASEVQPHELDDSPYTHDESGQVWYLVLYYLTPSYPLAGPGGIIVQEIAMEMRTRRPLYKRLGFFNRWPTASLSEQSEEFTII